MTDAAEMLEWALYYDRMGYSVVPTAPGTKRPAVKWEVYETKRPARTLIRHWYGGPYRECGVGGVTGKVSQNLFVVDPDSGPGKIGPETLDDLQMLYDDLPMTWTAKTGGGGRHYHLLAPEGMRIRSGSNVLGPHVDVRGEGGYIVLPPSVHPSGRPYEWIPGLSPGEIDIAMAPDWLLELVKDDGSERVEFFPGRPSTGWVGSEFSAFGRRIDGRESYMRDLLWARLLEEYRKSPITPDGEARGRILQETWEIFERKVKARTGTLASEGRGIEEMQRKLGYALKKWNNRIAIEARHVKPGSTWNGGSQFEPSNTPSPGPTGPLAIIKAFPIDAATLPRRPWVIRGILMRNHVTVLVAPSGVGKSLFTCQQALALAAGEAWGGWSPPERPMRVLVINSEDDIDEMRRRMVVAARIMSIDQSVIVDNVFLAEQPETIVIARADARTKTVIRTPLVEAIVETIQAEKIDVTVVDPFAETFEGDENSNSELKWAAVLWREIARRTHSAINLVHHTRKYASGDMSGNADVARGAGALIGVARIVSTMFDMTDEEAQLFGVPVEDRRHYVRHDDAKATFTLITGAARWFEKASREVGNVSLAQVGDEVGILIPWKPPGLMDGLSTETINQALTIIDEGLLDDDGRPTGALYTARAQSSDRWAGRVLCNTFGCDEKRAKEILKIWMEVKPGDTTGLLIEVEYNDGKQARKGLKVDAAKRPGRIIS